MPLNHQIAVGATELSDVKRRIELRYLWLHEIRRFEIVLGVSNQSTIARMVNGLHRRNYVYQTGIMVVDMFHEFRLGVRWACNENSTRAGYRLCNPMKKVLILRSVPATDGIRFVMDMQGRIMRMQNQTLNVRPSEIEHAGFMMINPDDRMVMPAHNLLLC